ncbi:MAG: DNA recombination/repair protein RecA, partial [Clostridia bacterium]|nr:DNA recombination/repair protein RecA [Clostridia bacterium]
RKVDVLKQGGEAVGNRVRMKVVKNKVAPPFRVAEADLMYGEGFSREGSLLDMGVSNKLVSKTGAWFSYGDMRIGQGRENAKQFLKDNPEVANELEAKLRAIMGTAECIVEMSDDKGENDD